MAKKSKAAVSISEAARLTGKNRQTIYRHIGTGKVSAVDQGDGTKGIPITELERVYGLLGQNENVSLTISPVADNVTALQGEIAELKADNKRLSDLVEELRRDKAWLQKLVDDLTIKRLPAPGQSVWNRLFGTGKE